MTLPHLDQFQLSHPQLNQLRSPIWVYDPLASQMLWANQAALNLWEADSIAELAKRNFLQGQSHAVRQTLLGYIERFDQQQVVDVWWEISPRNIKKRVFCRISGILIDCPEAANGKRPVLLIEGQDSSVLHPESGIAAAAMAAIFTPDGKIISSNPPFVEQFGREVYSLQQILPDHLDICNLESISASEQDLELNTLHGLRWHHLEVATSGLDEHETHKVITLIDIQERKLRELEHAREAMSDPLTGLMNRRGLLQYMGSHSGQALTLFYIDLDGFKPVNDSYGHSAGDELLCQLANLLMAQPGKKICARLGGDEFIIVYLSVLSDGEIRQATDVLLDDLAQPFYIDVNYQARISASIGIARSPQDGNNIDDLLIKADAAMYRAKKQGRSQAVIYQQGMESFLRRRTQILQYLDSAISAGEFSVVYQPIVDGITGQARIVEALLRWNNPVLGPLSPLEFIPIAEDSGKIAKLESQVVEQVCRDLPQLRHSLGSQLSVSINISGAHIAQQGFVEKLNRLVAENNASSADIVLELTESVLVPAMEENNPCLQQLSEAGYRLAIDDFGTGYSSLAYINRLPAHYVKIDKAFVDNINDDVNTVLFIRDLCQNFNMQCIAEGVETRPQSEVLNQIEIRLQQGYFFYRPQPIRELAHHHSIPA